MTEPGELSLLLVTLGAVLLVSPLVDAASRRLGLPRVTLLLALGLFVGPVGLDVVPAQREHWYPALAEVALAMVGFLLGGAFAGRTFREHGRSVLSISLAVTVATFVLVGGGLVAVGVPWPVAVVLGTAATATDPAAVESVVREGRAEGPVTSTLLGVVAVDDVWGMLLFAGVLAGVGSWFGEADLAGTVVEATWEIGGSVALGGLLGVPMAYVTGRLKPGEPTRAEALGFVLLCSGVATVLGVSYLLACVVMGGVVANLAQHHEVAFHELEGIEGPFLVLFFVLSGASAHLDGLRSSGWLMLAYVALRVGGRLLGGWVSARSGIGLALLPQAGVALGMTLVAVERIPELGRDLLHVVVLATVLFEVAGPILTRWALTRAGELKTP